jgi:DNA-directed RNA polymerase specialized sigma24 family protein
MNESATEPPDHELLQRIGNRLDDSLAAEAAFTLFFERHRDYVFAQVGYAKRKLGLKGIDETDFCLGVFRRVWESGGKSYSANRANESVCERLSVRAWLGTIAKNLLREELRERAKVFEPSVETYGLVDDLDNDPKQTFGAVELIQAVESLLSDRDARVVWFKIGAYDPVNGNAEPDAEAVQKFCEENGISASNLRKIYSRAIKTLQASMLVADTKNQIK